MSATNQSSNEGHKLLRRRWIEMSPSQTESDNANITVLQWNILADGMHALPYPN